MQKEYGGIEERSQKIEVDRVLRERGKIRRENRN